MTTGETERALRADILGAVTRGWCSPNNAAKVMDADLAEAITAELLPLFNAGMEQARRETANVADFYMEELRGKCKRAQETVRATAVAGAYAAAAKRLDALADVQDALSENLSKRGRIEGAQVCAEISEHLRDAVMTILALTPADARQAQTPTCDLELERLQRKVAEIMEAGYELAKSVLTCDAYLGGNVSQLKLLTGKARAIVNEVEGKSLPLPLSAAIASAEARARLEEAKWLDLLMENTERMNESWWSKRKRVKQRIAELEAAARTPDSATKITVTHGGLPGTVSPSASGIIARCESPDSTKEPE